MLMFIINLKDALKVLELIETNKNCPKNVINEQ
jgi:hypothetical protein